VPRNRATTVIADIEVFDPRRASGGDVGDGTSPVQPGRSTYSIEFDGGSWYEPKYADDDTLIIPSYRGGDVRLDVRDGSLTQAPPPTWQKLGGPHHSGRIAGSFGEDGAMLRYVANSELEVFMPDGTVLARLRGSAGGIPMLSPCGRWASTLMARERSSALPLPPGAPVAYEGDLLIWDLLQLER
jgi:hypothetical protein